MRIWFKNPIAFTFAVLAVACILLAVFAGGDVAGTLQLIFVPYSYDASYSFGKTLAGYIATALLVIQIILIAMLTLVHKVSNTVFRRTLWGFGVVLVVIYFTVMILSTVRH